jgi:hypothetical protein
MVFRYHVQREVLLIVLAARLSLRMEKTLSNALGERSASRGKGTA